MQAGVAVQIRRLLQGLVHPPGAGVDIVPRPILQGQGIGLDGDVYPAQVAYVLADGQGPVDMRCLIGFVRVLLRQLFGNESVVLLYQCLGPLFEVGPVLGGPPVVKSAVSVVLAALVVESVPDFVSDYGPDAPVVGGIVGCGVKEGGCRIAAGKTMTFRVGS